MFIEDPEGFKTWLTAKLEPLCEADPAALAKYVYALVKKDKPIEELKLSMVEQLEVFLQKETKGFVELLFKTLETGDFEVKTSAQADTAITAAPVKPPLEDVDLRVIANPVVPPLPPPPPIPPPAPPKNLTTEPSPAKKEPVKETANTTTTTVPTVSVTTSTSTQDNQTFGSLLHSRKENNVERHPKKVEPDDRVRPPRSRARRGMSMSPPMERSRRSRSYERRRSRSRDRDRSRAWRNKSPPMRPRYMDRRRSYSKSPIRRHSRSRSPPVKRGRYRNRSPPLRSHTRSLSPSRNSLERAILGSPGRRDTDLRLSSSGQISSVLGINSDKPFGTKRCRDFDEKGFCMRGDLCPFDHGSDPVVLEDLPGSIYNGAAQVGPRAATNPLQIHHSHESPNSLEYNPSAPSLEPRIWRRFYRPSAIRGRGGLISGGGSAHAVPGAMEGAPFPKRELISVITGSPLPAREPSTPPYRASLPPSREMMGKRYEPYSRMGMSRRNASKTGQGGTGSSLPPATHPTNNTLQLKKVPLQFNNITHLNEHFSKFGKIVNILVGFEGDPESALITFSSYMEANNAYKSTEPILNNRFIKVFWYTPQPSTTNNGVESKQENVAPGGGARPSIMERLGAPNTKVLNSLQPANVTQQQEARGNSKVVMSNNNISKTIYVPSSLKKENNINRVLTKDDLVKKKIDEEALKEAKLKLEAKKEKIKMNAELRKRKQVLLEKQLNQQKLLIERMEGGNIKNEQKTTIMSTIKSLQESIEKLKKDLAQDVEASLSNIQTNKKPAPPPNPAELFRKTKEEAQRELLDAELDLLKQEQQGKDIVELKKKISDLKLKAFQHKIPIFKNATPAFPAARGRGATFRARGRGTSATVRGRGSGRFTYNSLDYNVVDHRPTKLLVSGYEQDDKAEVLAHFNQFGEMVNYTSDDATPSLVLNYKTRKEAESALAKGRNFQDRLLSVTWATPNHNIRPGVTTQNPQIMPEEDLGEDVLISGEEEDEIVGLMSPSESLILQDEEEDEEEDRTWRR